MNQTMNEMFKKDLPNLHEWCEEYAARTGVKIYAGNPPIALIMESLMGKVEAIRLAVVSLTKQVESLSAPDEEPKKEKKSK